MDDPFFDVIKRLRSCNQILNNNNHKMGAEFSMNGFLKSVTEITQKENGFVIKIKGD